MEKIAIVLKVKNEVNKTLFKKKRKKGKILMKNQ